MKCTTHDTLGLPMRQQLRHWQDATDHYFGSLQAQSLCDGPFDARLTACEAGCLRLLTVDAPAHRVMHGPSARDVPHDSFKLVLQLQGMSEICQRDATFRLHPGDWSLYDPGVPYTITSRASVRQLVVQIPRGQLGPLRPGPLHTCEAHSPALAALHQVLSSFLGSLAAQLRTLPDAAGVPLSDTAIGLLVQVIQAQQGDAAERVLLPDVLRARVRLYIHSHLDDAGLSVERIARDMRCSKRYLHVLFKNESHTLDRHIWMARLERCRQALAGTDAAAVSISALAYRWGFNSSAHFCRLFKREYGATPGEFLRSAGHPLSQTAPLSLRRRPMAQA